MTQERQTARLALPVSEHDHVEGPATAAVTLVEHGDYGCPYCGRAYPIVKEVQRRLGDRLRFVYRSFPLSQMHPYAQHAAEADEAAAAQEEFWQMHDALYEHQRALDDAHLAKYAAGLGLDTTRFAHDTAAHVFAARVHEDFLSGVRSGVNGTPTFFINGARHDGSYELDPLLAAIQQANGRQA
ncbi:MAG: DsbA family protein [Dehalococcoidia bacterium]